MKKVIKIAFEKRFPGKMVVKLSLTPANCSLHPKF